MVHFLETLLAKIFTFTQSENQEENIPSVIYRLIEYFNIKITWLTTLEFFKTDPDFPTFKSISNFFKDNRITYYALKLEELDLYLLDKPFIACLRINTRGWKVILVYQLNENRIIYADSINGKRIMSKHDFIEKWGGIVFVIEHTDSADELDYKEKMRDEIVKRAIVPFAFAIFLILFLFSLFFGNLSSAVSLDPLIILIYLASMVGLALSILLFRQELDLKTAVTDRLCNLSNNFDCKSVIKSNVSKIYGSINWADVGIVYFAGSLILLTLQPIDNNIALLTLLSICSFPYTIFSILYQWLKVKKWCPLCLSVQAILLTELIFLIIRIKALELSISILIPAFLIYSVTLIFTLLIKFIIIGEKEKNYLKTNQLKLKRNPSLFAQHIQISERINIPQKDITFVFGELQSTITVTLFLSTTCSACSKEFDEILNLMRRNLRIRIQLIFAKPNDALSITFLRIIFVMMKAGKNSEALEMIKIWYKTAIERREKILKNTYIPEEYDDFLKMFNDSKNLFRNIQKVPTIMINGIKLPDFYSLEDIRYHIPELEKENRYSEIENKQNNRKK